ncbi:protein translocase subunit SecD [Actinopolymorpha sp. B9G3]|uniref:protein translocase subunit SecD n=1 Tax=Actinopolymorpha sp. B9G3 TaxID=3158970 RepID=UPI0032D98ED4
MSRAPLFRAILTFGILAAALYFAISTPVKLGLDLRGGTQIVLETHDGPAAKADAESTSRALEVLRRRVDALGVSEPSLTQSGDRRIIVELPGVQDPREAERVIGRTAQLTFHPVVGVAQPKEKPKKGEKIIADEQGQRIKIGPTALTGEGVTDASGMTDPQQGLGWFVNVKFTGAGGDAWAKVTGEAACAQPGDPKRRVAIVLDNRVISSPQVEETVPCNVGIAGGETTITGDFTQESAQELAVLIKGGALPVPVETIEQRTVGPTLGAEAIEASWKAGVIGLALTGLFIIVVYRLMGALATIALASYALLSYATLVALGATLTLPGLAGFVLAIGMAIDANVLVFERAREEYAAAPKRGLTAALSRGFSGAWSAIIDSNVTTLLAAGLLFFLASGPVRGFGVTLSVGVIASLVSALIIARVLTEWAVKRSFVRNRPGITGLAALGRVRTWLTERNPDLMSRKNLWLAISATVVIVAIAGIFVRGLNWGVEFTGGRVIEYSTSRPVNIDAAREAVADAGFPRAVVQRSGEDNVSVRTGQLTTQQAVEVQEALGDVGGEVTKERDELIGPSLGTELRIKALIALGVALLAQMAYLAIRFRWTFGVSAVLAMFHDILFVTGVFAWLGRPIDGVYLAAALTIIGLSVNDTVVVFDRVRELWAGSPRTPFATTANTAALQTVPRTINTGLGAMFILAALAVLGGSSLTDFAVALLLGLLVGTYSSVFTATPLAITLQAKSASGPPRTRSRAPEAAARRRARQSGSGAVV